ncbi:hypothetical protein BSLG_005991 [Batrachochytrium salamandrivorans]|nr:hypothetical protein BSLG_005991 [Batrachochytrium salamandrivorans]
MIATLNAQRLLQNCSTHSSFHVLGNSLDIIHAHDHCLLVATAEPSMLTIISPDHRTYQKIELYEYVPATSGTRLYIAEVSPNVICILNSVENNIVLLDFIKGLTSILSTIYMHLNRNITLWTLDIIPIEQQSLLGFKCNISASNYHHPLHVIAWPRSVDDYAHNEYINIEPCFQYLKISEQLATLIPSENNTTMTEKTLYLISGKRLNLGKLVELPDGNLLFMNNLGLVSGGSGGSGGGGGAGNAGNNSTDNIGSVSRDLQVIDQFTEFEVTTTTIQHFKIAKKLHFVFDLCKYDEI